MTAARMIVPCVHIKDTQFLGKMQHAHPDMIQTSIQATDYLYPTTSCMCPCDDDMDAKDDDQSDLYVRPMSLMEKSPGASLHP